MKLVLAVLFTVLSYNVSALACGQATPAEQQYSVSTKAKEVSLPVSKKAVLILNSRESRVETKELQSKVDLIPVRIELASDANVDHIVIATNSATMYLNQFALYRCPNSPTSTDTIYVDIGEYSSLVVYLIKGDSKVIPEEQEPNLELTGAKIKELLK